MGRDHETRLERLVGGWEGKNIDLFRTDGLGDLYDASKYDVPELHWYQIQWCLGVCGLKKWWYAPLVGGNRPRFDHVIDFDPEFFDGLVKIARAFWFNHVVPGVAPEVNGAESSRAYLALRFPRPTRAEMRTANDQERAWALAYLEAHEGMKPLKAKKDEAQNKLENAIGESGGSGILLGEGGWVCTWDVTATGRRFGLRRPK